MMEITQIDWKYFSPDPQDRYCAFCNIIVDGQLVIRGVKVKRGRKRLVVEYPKKSDDVNGYVYPIDKELQQRWEDQILEAYRSEYIAQSGVV